MKYLILFLIFVVNVAYSAEFLVYAKEHYSYKENMNASEIKENKTHYKKGDIVLVYKDGTLKEKCVNSAFYFIKIESLSYADALIYMSELASTNLTEKEYDRKRKYHFDLDAFSQELKDQLEADREITITIAQLESNVVTKEE